MCSLDKVAEATLILFVITAPWRGGRGRPEQLSRPIGQEGPVPFISAAQCGKVGPERLHYANGVFDPCHESPRAALSSRRRNKAAPPPPPTPAPCAACCSSSPCLQAGVRGCPNGPGAPAAWAGRGGEARPGQAQWDRPGHQRPLLLQHICLQPAALSLLRQRWSQSPSRTRGLRGQREQPPRGQGKPRSLRWPGSLSGQTCSATLTEALKGRAGHGAGGLSPPPPSLPGPIQAARSAGRWAEAPPTLSRGLPFSLGRAGSARARAQGVTLLLFAPSQPPNGTSAHFPALPFTCRVGSAALPGAVLPIG